MVRPAGNGREESFVRLRFKWVFDALSLISFHKLMLLLAFVLLFIMICFSLSCYSKHSISHANARAASSGWCPLYSEVLNFRVLSWVASFMKCTFYCFISRTWWGQFVTNSLCRSTHMPTCRPTCRQTPRSTHRPTRSWPPMWTC